MCAYPAAGPGGTTVAPQVAKPDCPGMEPLRHPRLIAQLARIAASHPGARFVEARTRGARTSRIIVSFVTTSGEGARYGSYVLAPDGRILETTGAAHAPGDQLGLRLAA